MPAEPLSSSQMWVFIGLAMFALIYIAIVRPLMRKKSDPLERSSFDSLSRHRGVERQMETLVVELSDMTRQIGAQLDTRAAKLEQLIQDADRRIETLQGMLQGNPRPIASPTVGLPEPTPEPMPDPRHAEIYSLADQGNDANQIASRLDRPRGEVELILALRGKG